MSKFDDLLNSMIEKIRTNGTQSITGQIMQDVLRDIIETLTYYNDATDETSGSISSLPEGVSVIGSKGWTGAPINLPSNLPVLVTKITLDDNQVTLYLIQRNDILEIYGKLNNGNWIKISSTPVSLDATEKILSMNNNILKTNLTLDFQNNVLIVKGKNNREIDRVDLSSLIVEDHYIDEVTIDGTDLVLSYHNGLLADLRVDLTPILDTIIIPEYTGSEAISVSSYVVSLKLDPESESFVSIGQNGLKISGIQSAIDAAINTLSTQISAKLQTITQDINTLKTTTVQSAEGDKYVYLTKSGTKVTASISPSSDVANNEDKLVTGAVVKQYVDEQIESKTSSVYTYKGSCTYAELPADAEVGDVWDVTDEHDGIPAGTNYAWNGTIWDPQSGKIDLTLYLKKEEASQTYVPKTTQVNSKPLSENIELSSDDIEVGGSGSQAGKTITEAIESLEANIEEAAGEGVISFGGKTGAITLDTSDPTETSAKPVMEDNTLKIQSFDWSNLISQAKNDANLKVHTISDWNFDPATIDDDKEGVYYVKSFAIASNLPNTVGIPLTGFMLTTSYGNVEDIRRVLILKTADSASQSDLVNQLFVREWYYSKVGATTEESKWGPWIRVATTEELASKLNVDGSNATNAGVEAMLNKVEQSSGVFKDTDVFMTTWDGTTDWVKKSATSVWNWIKGKADTIYAKISHTHTKSQITDFPTLATVATSGSYNDLTDKPDISSSYIISLTESDIDIQGTSDYKVTITDAEVITSKLGPVESLKSAIDNHDTIYVKLIIQNIASYLLLEVINVQNQDTLVQLALKFISGPELIIVANYQNDQWVSLVTELSAGIALKSGGVLTDGGVSLVSDVEFKTGELPNGTGPFILLRNADGNNVAKLKIQNGIAETEEHDGIRVNLNALSDFTGASNGANGTKGLVPAPQIGAQSRYLKGNGTWSDAVAVLKEVENLDDLLGTILSDGVTGVYGIKITKNTSSLPLLLDLDQLENDDAYIPGTLVFDGLGYICEFIAKSDWGIKYKFIRRYNPDDPAQTTESKAYWVREQVDWFDISNFTTFDPSSYDYNGRDIIRVRASNYATGYPFSEEVEMCTGILQGLGTADGRFGLMLFSASTPQIKVSSFSPESGWDTWQDIGQYTLPTASPTVKGGIRLNYNSSGKNYKVQVDGNGDAFVNVPWTDTNTTYSNATPTQDGLMSAEDKVKVNRLPDTTISLSSTTLVKITISNGIITSYSLVTANDIPNLGANKITTLSGYSEGTSTATITSSMSLNAALASLQNQIQALQTRVKALEDAEVTINKAAVVAALNETGDNIITQFTDFRSGAGDSTD